MLSLSTAIQLKEAGLKWTPGLLDYFAIPERGMDEKVFVISDLLVTVEMLSGSQIVSFQGASEWALDYLVTSEAVWVPREDQLRQLLQDALLMQGNPGCRLISGLKGCTCTIELRGAKLEFTHPDASEAYAQALLTLLQAGETLHLPDTTGN